MTKLMDVDLIEEIQDKYGEVVAQAILDHLNQRNIKDRDLQCTEVLQMSEILQRFKSALREKITMYRSLETKERMIKAELATVKKEQKVAMDDINKTYSLYKEIKFDFWGMYRSYMNKKSVGAKENKKVFSKVVNYGKARSSQANLLDSYVLASNKFENAPKKLSATA